MEDTVSVHLVPKGPGGVILPDPLPQLGTCGTPPSR
jgi:hypothetical protein